jgi:hypothetical protein
MERQILQTGARRAIVDFGIPVLIGILFFWAFTRGGEIALPTKIDWILVANGDPVQHYVGWNFFRDAPFFQWPFGRTLSYGETLSSSIVFTDSIPLLAFIFRPFSSLLPGQFQYLGLWILACFILQAVFAWQLISHFTRDNWHRTFATGLVVLSPPMLWRLSGHEALIGHWLILAALCVFLHERRKIPLWTVLLCVASLVHAYLCAMVIAIWLTDVIRRLAYRTTPARKIALEVLVAVLCLGAVMDFAGYFISTGVTAGGFGYFRMNLLAFFDPSPIWSAFYSDPYRNGDYEGFAYLGVGTLLLTIIALGAFTIRRKPIGINRQIVLPLAILAALLIVYALSDHVAFGSHELFHYRLPGFMRKVSSTFRVSGRFVWPVVYLIELAVFAVLFSQIKTEKRLVSWVLFVLLALQGYDMTKAAAALHARWTLPYSPSLQGAFWREAAKKYSHIALIYPTEDTQDVGSLLLFASDNHISVNGGSIARIDPTKLRLLQGELRQTVAKSTYRADTLYVVLRDSLWNEAVDKYTGGLKGVVDGYKVIAPGWTGCSSQCGVAVVEQSPLMKFPQTIDLSLNGSADSLALKNWSSPEPTGRWTDGKEASMRLYVGKAEANALLFTFDLRPYVGTEHPKQTVAVAVNGVPIAIWKFSDNSLTTEQIRVPSQLIREAKGAVSVDFDLPDAVSPKQLGFGSDDRNLAMFVHKITVDEAK